MLSAAKVRFFESRGKNYGRFCSRKCKMRAQCGAITRELIEENSIPEPNSGCWLWLGAMNYSGYGKIGYDGGKLELAHRASYLIFKGEIPAALCVRHHCDNPCCVNPGHIEVGTQAENSSDMVRRNRSLKGSKNHEAVFSEADVKDIKSRLVAGDLQKDIAMDYGVWPSAIQKIQTGESWRHVPWPAGSNLGPDGLHLPRNTRRWEHY